jgi:hypothetical protein
MVPQSQEDWATSARRTAATTWQAYRYSSSHSSSHNSGPIQTDYQNNQTETCATAHTSRYLNKLPENQNTRQQSQQQQQQQLPPSNDQSNQIT